MAARNSTGRGGSATPTRSRTRSRSSSGSRIAESDLAQLTVADIRGQLRDRGIPGIWSLRKPELVKRLANAMRAERRGGGAAAKTTPARSRSVGTAKRTGGPTAKRTGTPTAKRAGGHARSAGARSGRAGSRSLKYAQEITSPQDRPERAGRSLVTSNHEVIKRWAQERGAKPATIEGTERGDRPGVLTFDFPGWRSGGRLREVSWADWFKTFDGRRLNFIYQEQQSNGRQSNFFRVESPDREDA